VDGRVLPGESNVYTIGYIGQHKVVSTKLPAVGRQMAAQISSGNTTTRLLGIFSVILISGNLGHTRCCCHGVSDRCELWKQLDMLWSI